MLSPHNFLYIFYLFTPLLHIQIKWGFLWYRSRIEIGGISPKKTYSFISNCKLLGILCPFPLTKQGILWIHPSIKQGILCFIPSFCLIRTRRLSLEEPILMIWVIVNKTKTSIPPKGMEDCAFGFAKSLREDATSLSINLLSRY